MTHSTMCIKLEMISEELGSIQDRIPIDSSISGFLEINRSEWIGCPPHSPRIHKKVKLFENHAETPFEFDFES